MVPPKKDKPTKPPPEIQQPAPRRFSISQLLARFTPSRTRRRSPERQRPTTAPNPNRTTNTSALSRYSHRHGDSSLLSRPVTPREMCPYDPGRLTPFGDYEEGRPWTACGMVIRCRRTPIQLMPCEDCINGTPRSHIRERARNSESQRGNSLDSSAPRPVLEVPANLLNGHPRRAKLPTGFRPLSSFWSSRSPEPIARAPTRRGHQPGEVPFPLDNTSSSAGRPPTRHGLVQQLGRGSTDGCRLPSLFSRGNSPSSPNRPQTRRRPLADSGHSSPFDAIRAISPSGNRNTPSPTTPTSPKLHYLPHLPGRKGTPYVHRSELAQHEAALRAGRASPEVMGILNRPASPPRNIGRIDFSGTAYYDWPGQTRNRPSTPALALRPTIETVIVEVEVEDVERAPSRLRHELSVEEMSSSSSDHAKKSGKPRMRGGGDEDVYEWTPSMRNYDNGEHNGPNLVESNIRIITLLYPPPRSQSVGTPHQREQSPTPQVACLRGGGGSGWKDTDRLPPTLWWLGGGRGKPITVASWKKQKPKNRMGGLLGMAIYGHKAGTPYKSEKEGNPVIEGPAPDASSSPSGSGDSMEANAGSFASSSPSGTETSSSSSSSSSSSTQASTTREPAPAPGDASATTASGEGCTAADNAARNVGDTSGDAPATQENPLAPGNENQSATQDSNGVAGEATSAAANANTAGENAGTGGEAGENATASGDQNASHAEGGKSA